MKFFVMSWWIL